MTTQEADMSMKRDFAAMGSSSDEEFEGDETENQSLLALEQKDDYDFLALVAMETKEEKETCRSQETILALMAESDSEKEEEEEDINEKVILHNLQENLGSYSKRELESLLYTLIDAYKTLDSKRVLIMKDYASLREENKSLEKQNLHLLSKNTKLSKNLELVTKRNETLSKELLVTKTEAENGMRWTRSSILLDSIHKNRTFEKHGIGFDRTSSQVKNPNIDCLCMHCGLVGHKSHDCQKKQTAHNKNLKSLRKPHHDKPNEQKQIPTDNSLPRLARRNLIHPFPKLN